MKKIYIQPSLEVIDVENEDLLCESIITYAGSNEDDDAPTVAETKGQSIWDMEW